VTKATIRVIFKGVSASKMTVCIRQDAGSTPVTVIDQIVEMGGCVTDYIDDSNTACDIKMLTLSLDVAKMQGMTYKEIVADSTLRGSAAASPTEICYFHVQAWDAAAQTGSINCDVIMEQRAIFTEPRTQSESLKLLKEFGSRPKEESKNPQLSKEDKSFVHICCGGK